MRLPALAMVAAMTLGTIGVATANAAPMSVALTVNGSAPATAGTATTTATYTTGTWYHIALVRSGTTNTLYVNGVSSASNSTSPTWPTTPSIGVGRLYNDNTSYTLTGYISDLRITNGFARYTANFTPPAGQLTGQ